MLEKIKSKVLLFPALAGVVAAGSSVVAFAAEEVGSPAALPSITITTEMLTPLVEGIVSNISVILPVGLGLLAIMASVRIIPRMISRFLA